MGKGPKQGLKRSGLAIVQYCEQIKWNPDIIFSVGVGLQCKEVELMHAQWPNVPMVGFEPHPSSYDAIKDTFPGRLFSYGLSSYKHKAPIRNRTRHKNGASLYSRLDRTDNEEHWVTLNTLDDHLYLLDEMKDPEVLLWCDCEGSERDVLVGGKEFIKRGVKVINVEMTGRPEYECWPRPKEVHQHLTDLGFTTVWIHSIRTSICQYDAIYLKNDLIDDTMRIFG